MSCSGMKHDSRMNRIEFIQIVLKLYKINLCFGLKSTVSQSSVTSSSSWLEFAGT